MNKLRTIEIDTALAKTISRSRLRKYLSTCEDDVTCAITAYERNTRLAESFYTPLQCLEVCFRNRLHERMSEEYGGGWMTNGHAPLAESSTTMVQSVLNELQKESSWPSNDDMVSEMKFAFWVGLLGPGYDSSIWRKTLYKGFAIRKRATLHSRFNAIRRFRNRIAHHEPIFQKNLPALHAEIIESISWVCPDTAKWAAHESRFEMVYAAA